VGVGRWLHPVLFEISGSTSHSLIKPLGDTGGRILLWISTKKQRFQLQAPNASKY